MTAVMRIKRFIVCLVGFASMADSVWGQGVSEIFSGVEVTTEAQGSLGDGKTPLWLNANKYGLSSLDEKNCYIRVAAARPIVVDSMKNWRLGYGLDLAVAANHSSTFVVNQAYVEGNYKKFLITAGAKRRVPLLSNQMLSSGAMTYGWNSLPIPQLSLDIDWFSVPWTNDFWKIKIHGSYGMTTDGDWQKSFVCKGEHYTGNVLYHEKAIYLKFGKEDARIPLTYELGLQMGAQFGGTSYNVFGRVFEEPTTVKHPVNFRAFINALISQGTDETDGSSKNTAGNHFGSWIMRLKWHGSNWSVAGRFERYFEDQSMMFVQYGIYDHLLGAGITLPDNPYLSAVTIEHMSTRDQSGAILHDAAKNIPDKMNGMDNYYNHNLYSGYQHRGQANGNPLLLSPIYNDNHSLVFFNNRLTAWHFGLSGNPLKWLNWRALATFTRNWGSYDAPLDDPTNQQYFLLEASANPSLFKGWQAVVGIGIDKGKLIGNNSGVQLTIRKTFKL